MKVGSRTRSCLSASCGMCYPLLHRWTQRVELRKKNMTLHWLVQRESHNDNPCNRQQHPPLLCNSVFFFVAQLKQNSPHDFKRWTISPKRWSNRKSAHLFCGWGMAKPWRLFRVSMWFPKPSKYIGSKITRFLFLDMFLAKGTETQHSDIEVVHHDVRQLAGVTKCTVWPSFNHVMWDVTSTYCHEWLPHHTE